MGSGSQWLGELLGEYYLQRALLRGEDHADSVFAVLDIEWRQRADAVVARLLAGKILRGLDRVRKGGASSQESVVQPAVEVHPDEFGRIGGVDSAVTQPLGEHQHGRRKPVATQMRALPGEFGIPRRDRRGRRAATNR